MADNIIQIKRSANTDTPPDGTLAWGELAYSFSSDALFIGTEANTVIEIGGNKYFGYLDHTPGQLTANSAILVDDNSHVNFFNTAAFRISASGVTTDWITSIVNQITGSGSNNQIVSSYGIKNYVDSAITSGLNNNSANVSITGGSIAGVDFSSANVNITGGSITAQVLASSNVNITGGSISGVSLNNLDAPLDVDDGGTGVNSFTENSVAYVDSNTNILSFLTGANGDILQISGSVPTFAGIDGGSY